MPNRDTELRAVAPIAALLREGDDSWFSPAEKEYFIRRGVGGHSSRAVRILAKKTLLEFLHRKMPLPPAPAELEIFSDGEPPRLVNVDINNAFSILISLAHSETHAACYMLIREL